MRTESCRERRESLGAYVLGHLPTEERRVLEAHLEGCAECRAEADSLASVSRLLALADPGHFGPAPLPPPELAGRIEAAIAAERDGARRRVRRRLGLGLSAAAAAAAVLLLIFIVPTGSHSTPEQRVNFASLPPGIKIAAALEPGPFGTEIRMYVSGFRSGTLCRVFLRAANDTRVSAGTFRYRWGGHSEAVLSSALDISRATAIVVHAGGRTFNARINGPGGRT